MISVYFDQVGLACNCWVISTHNRLTPVTFLRHQAVCCVDGVHCCAQGEKCDDKGGACVKAIPWSTKVAASPLSQNAKSVICPDREHECPDMSTCCRLSTGLWGCCPLPKVGSNASSNVLCSVNVYS